MPVRFRVAKITVSAVVLVKQLYVIDPCRKHIFHFFCNNGFQDLTGGAEIIAHSLRRTDSANSERLLWRNAHFGLQVIIDKLLLLVVLLDKLTLLRPGKATAIEPEIMPHFV